MPDSKRTRPVGIRMRPAAKDLADLAAEKASLSFSRWAALRLEEMARWEIEAAEEGAGSGTEAEET